MKVKCGTLLSVISVVAAVAGGLACRAEGEQAKPVSSAQAKGLTDANDTFFPFSEDNLERRERAMFGETDPAVLARVEADARKRLESGGIPPAWQNLVPKLTREQCAKMSTPELAEACFSSSYLTRRLLAGNSSSSINTLITMKVWYPCYGELLERQDLWKGVLKAYSVYASRLDPKGDPNTAIDGIMGFSTLNSVFQLPKLQEQLRGRETLFVRAQLDAIKKIRSYIDGDPDDALRSSTPLFSGTAPISLIESSLIFMRRGFPSQSAPVITRISNIPLSKKPTMGQIKTYLDAVTPQIEQFLRTTAPPLRGTE